MSVTLKHIVILTVCSIVIKVLYLLFASNIHHFDNDERSYTFSYKSYIDLAKKKDAGWYEGIATYGYQPLKKNGIFDISQEQSNWAFFPLYPLSIYGLTVLLDTHYDNAAFILSLFFSVFALIGIYVFTRDFWQDDKKALFTAFVFLLLPFHFYFACFLTEALFVSLLIWAFAFIQNDKKILAMLCCSALVLCRPNGILMLLPIAIFALERKQIQSYLSKEALKQYAFMIPAVIFFVLYGAYQYNMTGDFLAFSSAQEAWGKKFTWPWMCFFNSGSLSDQFNSCYVIAMMVLVIFLRNKWSLSFHLIFWLSVLIPLIGGSIDSMPRYLSIVFPIAMLIAQWAFKFKRAYLFIALILILQLMSLYPYLRDWDMGF